MNFDTGSDGEGSDKSGEDDDKVHKPGPLQADSDESDFEVMIVYLKSVHYIMLYAVTLCIDGIKINYNLRCTCMFLCDHLHKQLYLLDCKKLFDLFLLYNG